MNVDYPPEEEVDLITMGTWFASKFGNFPSHSMNIRMTKDQWDKYALNLKEEFREPQDHNGEPSYSYIGYPVKVRK